jgi:hypothetical protein
VGHYVPLLEFNLEASHETKRRTSRQRESA